jgi:biotin transport system substrate-specific component
MSTEDESVELVGEQAVVNVARAALLAALMGAFAFVSFPNPLAPGIPVTLQVLGVFLAGIYLGPLWAGVAMTLYLAAGVAGAPVFANAAAGVAPLVGPTGGYLLSYPVAAVVVGAVVHGPTELRDPERVHVARLVGAMVGGTVVVYAAGTVGFSLVQDVPLTSAVVAAAVAFVPMELVKMAAAVGIVHNDAVAVE